MCGATTPDVAIVCCIRTSAKDTCHGCELWPDEIRFDAPKPLTVEGVQALADHLAAVEPMTEPPVDDILALAAVIRQVDGNHSLGAAALAEEILRHWRPPQQPVKLTDEELLRTYGLAKRDYRYDGPDDDWPNRAERAATICGLRAVLARCGHSVELVTPPPPSTEKLFRELDQLLDGFDRCSDHPKGGWWETEDGVKVGRIKLRELKELITRHLSPPQP
jgi:hypothetical protein